MQEFANPPSLRNAIFDLLSSVKLATDENVKLLDYTIQLFKNNGLFSDYYGYHNVDHELEVTYVTLLSGIHSLEENYLSKSDLNYLFASALLHDFDPDKSMDKPHEKNVIRFISKDQNIQKLLADANLDQNLICAIISRTVYPWIGDVVTNTEKLIQDYFSKSEIKDNKERQKHFRDLGHFLSISDRIGGYSLGDFQKAMEMSKMNAHSSSWHPAFIVRRSVVFFEDMLNNEPDMCQRVLNGLPKHMRKNFLDNIVGFMKLRQEEIQIYNQFVYDGLPLVPCIQKSTLSDDILDELLAIYRELPKPLQFTRDDFIESISDPETILNMLRIGDSNGRIIGFAKGGPLEKYNFDLDFEDRNRGKNNTVFLEPVAIKNGYWGFHGGRELRQLFMMQVQSKGYKFMTSFAMRDVIDERKENDKNVVFVKKFDPERWDYFRVTL
ncbi:MAG TPA: hypothetical protein QGF44_01045 [Candidatus Nitrosopelagicus sp.]|jgi:hypothetical protein|nr:hypothetical protein [Candidatus Nitrosopelagicus sp.]HJM45542.1 hypothetical protein [Candidatus Nitrosopelagicus sp.]|tara:strand:- start:1733 stop:3049 length:1317 start_codon:yes stop_codon:yes gene_type:complete